MSDREQDGAALPPGFDDFYRKTYARVLAWARFLAWNMADAEQAVTDAFTATAQRWDGVGVSGFEAAEAYVRTIVRRQLARTRRRWLRRYYAELHGPVPPPPSDPHLAAEAREVLALFPQLSRRQREVLALWCQEYTSEEIARELGMKSTAVRTHLQRARHKLRDTLGMRGAEDERAGEFVSAADQLTIVLFRCEAELSETFAADTERMERIRAEIIARLAGQARHGR
ncbi:MAG TPA: sigma-70 family RNA polymerase sigma factor [Streptosporangiaceae bacterium]|nr:sigma-70 family RNA polymerase sigma factor [Streptosporangiaceae bacterium]